MLCTGQLLFWNVFFWLLGLLAGISGQEEIFCTKPADLGILLDSSDATVAKWPEVLDFASALVEFFNVSPKGSKVGIITYDTDADIAMDFNTLQGDNLSPETVQDLIDDLKPGGEHRFIDKALTAANERLFTVETGMRMLNNDTSKFLVVLTAGKQTTDQGSFTPLSEASKPLRDKGIEIYVVGVGSAEEIDVNELIQIAGKEENVLTTERYQELVILAEDVAKVACGIKIVEGCRLP